MRAPDSFTVRSPVPVYAVALPRSDALLYAGGGGVSRSGVANVIRSVRLHTRAKTVEEVGDVKLSSEEDAPMCLAVSLPGNDEEEDEDLLNEEIEEAKLPDEGSTDGVKPSTSIPSRSATVDRKIVVGINSSVHASGVNQNLRLFAWTSAKRIERSESSSDAAPHTIESVAHAESVSITDADVYIRCTAVSPNGQLLAVGSTDGQMALHDFPSLERRWLLAGPTDASIADVTFSADSALVAFVTPAAVQIYPTTPAEGASSSNGGGASAASAPELYQSIQNPFMKGAAGCVFRAACFGRTTATGEVTKSSRLFTVVNTTPPAGLGSSKKDREKAKIRKCFVSAWDTDSWSVLYTRQISERPATVAALSGNGKHLAVSTSDLTVHLLSSSSLKTVWQLRDAHAFPGTCLAFSPNGDVLVSGSADMSMRVVQVGEEEEPSGSLEVASLLSGKIGTIAIAILLAVFAWYIQPYLVPLSTHISRTAPSLASSLPPIPSLTPPIPAAAPVETTPAMPLPVEL